MMSGGVGITDYHEEHRYKNACLSLSINRQQIHINTPLPQG